MELYLNISLTFSSLFSMPVLDILGVNVEFPFTPYDVQTNYMTKIIEALQTGQNAVLESPTGTGKTLCLLCATLAWRFSELKKIKALEVQDKQIEEGLGAWGANNAAPNETTPNVAKIIYASRTHSQLSQVVKELKRTAYGKQVVISLLGSREQMCIHPEVSKQTSNQTMVHMCRNKVNKHLCHFYNNVDDARKNGIFTKEVMDIEELVQLGNKRNACPYYSTREVSKQVECGVIFTPYNYLLDRKSRRSHNLEIGGNVIIFDEAHNLEKLCEESASFDLSSLDIANCIEEVGDLLNAVTKMAETGTVADGHEAGETTALSEFKKDDVALMKSFFLALEEHLDKIELPASKSKSEPGRYIFDFFSKVNLTFDTHEILLELMDKISSYLSTLSNSFRTRGTALQKFSEIIKVAFSASSTGPGDAGTPTFSIYSAPARPSIEELTRFYRVHICEDAPKTGKKDLWKKDKGTLKSKPSRTISYWCFSPGYAMQDLVRNGSRNLILTSGTISPIDSFVSELHVDFPITLVNGHVIDKHQIFVASLTRGMNGVKLESTFKSRGVMEQVVELGNTVAEVAKASPGGLLVFFPSYAAMEHYVKAWRESSDVMRKLESTKLCTVEPRGKGELKDAIEKFYSDVKSPQGGALFAICRGKVSEGLDFANDNGRAVLIVGIPFPPTQDAKVKLKMSFLDDLKRSGVPKVIPGSEWYRLQACRAVNQAIGRVIRHRYDYGAIILCDQRFTRKDQVNELPQWIQSHVTSFDDCPKAMRRLRSFFCSVREKENFRLRSLSGKDAVQPKRSQPAIDKRADKSTISSSASRQVSFGGMKKMYDITKLPKMSDPDCHVPSRVNKPNNSTFAPDCMCQASTLNTRKRKRVEHGNDSKKANLLDALDQCNDVTEEEEPTNLGEAEAHPMSTHLLVMDRRMAETQKKKKIKIKRPPTMETPLEDAKPSTSNGPTQEQPDERRARFGPAGGLLQTIKKVLNSEGYKTLKGATETYRQKENIETLVESLAGLFLDNPAHHYLLRAFVRFVRPKHHTRYSELCEILTGQKCILTQTESNT
uniref:Regulator of telomere elongation helicase 1 homolog n=1 Tax=Phallusia mammillata TaxID=59560 RepID=A0A6F9DS67_9ASCI|nr:regulator of telomere elongation helicase 1 [Phallusia mammillata]